MAKVSINGRLAQGVAKYGLLAIILPLALLVFLASLPIAVVHYLLRGSWPRWHSVRWGR